MEAGKAFAIEALAAFGFGAEEIPEAETRRADIRFTHGDTTYYIEVKEKFDSEQTDKERAAAFAKGEMFQQSEPLHRHERMSDVIKDAHRQLRATPKQGKAFELVWIHTDSGKAQQAVNTFYGLVWLSPRWTGPLDYPAWKATQPDEALKCFYFDLATSWLLPTIDALIVSDPNGVQLCLNEFSPRLNDLRKSELCKRLAAGVIDPVQAIIDGQAIACRATISRKSGDDAIAKALQEQTGTLYSPIRINRHSVSVFVPVEND